MAARTRPDPSNLRMVWRGLTMACAVCGRRRGLFRRWVLMAERCPRCDLRFERHEGYFVGAVGMNTLMSFAILLVGETIFFVATYPDIPTGWWVFAMLPALALIPIALYPVSKTLWTAINLLMEPLEDGEALPPQHWRSADADSVDAGSVDADSADAGGVIH